MPKTIETISHIRVGNVEHPIDAVTINGRQIPSASELLPNVSSSDNGKILRVLNGQWSLFSPGSLYNEINGIDCGDTIKYEEQYLSLEIITGGTIGFKNAGSGSTKTIQYSVNDGVWTSLTAGDPAITVSAGDVIRLKGTNTSYALSNQNYSGFGLSGATATYNVYGNIMSLIYGDNFIGQTTLTDDYAFCCLFDGSKAVSAENLILPADTLTKHCYRALFANCSNLTTGPIVLPATTLAESCYRFMFSADSLLVNAPVLPATTLAKESYYGLFNSCSSLNYIKCLATNISASNSTKQWVTGVASTGTFVKDPNMAGWTVNSVDGIPVGWTLIDNVVLSSPVISFANNIITITCATTGADIYYRLGTTGSFQVYSGPIEINDDAHVEAYSSLSGTNSSTVSRDVEFDYSKAYLTFDVKSSGNITWTASDSDYTKTISYSKNDGAWTDVTSSTSGETISVTTGDKVRFKGSNSAYGYNFSSTLKNNTFGGTATFDVYGNIMSLVGGDDFINVAEIQNAAFVYLFKNCTGVLSAANLKLPITTLTAYCYQSMFFGCTNLTSTPVLPATTLANACYNAMFCGCTSLTTAPVLPAVTTAQTCYYAMFSGCTSLTTAPALPATTLETNCYYEMFKGCTSLTSISTLSATSTAPNCCRGMFKGCTNLTTIPSTLLPTTLAASCYYEMFSGCTSLTSTPTLPATTLAASCYFSMFRGCSNLTTAPALPATTLLNDCYQSMFQNCTSLITAPSISATTLAANSCKWMFGSCTNLTTVSTFAPTTLADNCCMYMFQFCESLVNIPSTLPATTLATDCYSCMFTGCSSLTTAPELPATTLAQSCYGYMFANCTSLTTVPELPATTLASYCYQDMFRGCTNLNYIKCLATDISATNCTNNWVNGVAATGTFVKAYSMTDWTIDSINGIPIGWTLENEGDEGDSDYGDSDSESEAPVDPSHDYSQDYLTFNITSAGNIVTSVGNNTTYQYKKNDGEWTAVTSTISATAGDVIQFRGACQQYDHIKFEDSTCVFTLSGNVMSIYSSSTFTTNTTLSYASCFDGLFKNCPGLTSAENMVLPATHLTNYCYSNMFYGCTSLTTPPVLPASTLAEGSYGSMFKYCPSLDYIKCLATDISARYSVDSWVNGVAASGTFVKDPSMNDWTINSISGIPVGWTVVDNGDEGESEEPIITVSDPVISYSNNTVTITCATAGATIYYKLGENGEYQTYSSPVSLNESTTVYTYASLSGTNSTVVSENCVYVEPYEPGDSDYGDSDSESDVPVDPSHDYSQDYLTFNITTSGNIATTVGSNTSYQYRKNGGEWTAVTSTISVTAGDVVEFKGTLQRYEHIKFESSLCGFTVSGNVMSIYNPTTFTELTTMEYSNCFENLFKGCIGLTSAENLVLPATTLTPYCYVSMFEGCTSLTKGPVLEAATLQEGSYGSMFKYCSSLNYIKCLATDISIRYCVDGWVNGVAATGTFVKADSMNDWTIDSISGIPIGWTLINASDESGQDEGDSDSDYGDSDSEEPVVITVSAPEVSYSNNTVTITCETTGATIYYKLGQSGTYQEYTAPIALTGSVDVYTYATLNDVDSEEVTESCEYDYSLDYLTFDILTSGTILWDAEGSNATKTIEYSINDGTWTSVTSTGSGVAINVTAGDSVRFRGSNTRYCEANKSNYSRFGAGTATFNISGNIMSMTAGDNFANVTTLPATWTFTQFFKESKPVSAENLILPATTMTECCYRAMFSKCTTLEKAPALPATTLANNCYWYLFEDCAITKAPDLPATTLVNSCYGYMFTGCTSLNYIKCMATTGFNTTSCLQNWVNNVAATGTFVKDANTSWSTGVNGIPTGWVVFDGEIVEDPVIDFNGENKIEISCETSGATIYYRLGNSGNYSVYTGPITISVDTTVYTYAEKDGQNSQTVSQECVYSEHIYKFGDLVFASGPLYYGSNGYEIKDSWNYSSYGTVYGKTVGSTFFNFIEMGDLFKKSGFSASDGQILNTLDPLDGWRLPTKDEWDYIFGSTRPGSTVDGSTNKHYSFVSFDHDNDQSTGNILGLLIFPDNETITGAALSYFDNVSTNVITLEQFNNYLSQGCVFLPANGIYQTTTGFSYGGLNYWSSSDYSESTIPAYALRKYSEISTSLYNKEDCYLPVYLVKDTTYCEETPLEGATKSLNTWTI